jgi:hypothetical protein
MKSVADQFAETLSLAGVKRMYGIVGDSLNGLTAGSCGPGNLHLINRIFDCHRSRVPVLAIAHFFVGDRRRLLPGNPSTDAVSGVQPLSRAHLRRQPDAVNPRGGDSRSACQAQRIGCGNPRRRCTAACSAGSNAEAGKLAAARTGGAAGGAGSRQTGGAAEWQPPTDAPLWLRLRSRSVPPAMPVVHLAMDTSLARLAASLDAHTE